MKRLYPLQNEPTLDDGAFAEPPASYRAAPFWAWNGLVDEETIRRQLGEFKDMGMGGVHVHVRTGLRNQYLSDAFMALVRFCVEEGKRQGLTIWLYDEDRWPSGTAGGLVTKDERFAARYLLFTPTPYGAYTGRLDWRPDERHGNDFARSENGTLLARYDVRLDESGRLKSAARLADGETASGDEWYAYLEHGIPSSWMNGSPYVDVLNPEAIKRFRETTYERYRQAVGDEFGQAIPAIFTDEPQLTACKTVLSEPRAREDVFLPWTEALPGLLAERYQVDILAALPELWWERADGTPSYARYAYHDAAAELFASAYCDTLGDWCRHNGIRLAGHLMWEPTLDSQTLKLGEAMRCYRAFRELPGVDMLCDNREYNTLKQCQSAQRQQGGEGVLCELYGATGWDCDFRSYKLQGDWQAALGVTVRVPHLPWMTMEGEAKRDYPASIFTQSPWYRRFSVLEDHFARLNLAMTRGEPMVDVAVVHPIESYWLAYGNVAQTYGGRERMERRFAQLAEWLLYGLIDFDYLSEARLPDLCARGDSPLPVGRMRYRTVIVPGCRTLRGSTLERLRAFAAAGGRLIFLGDCPDCVDARPSEDVRALYQQSLCLPFEKEPLLEALQSERYVDARLTGIGNTLMRPRLTLPTLHTRPDFLLHQLRRDGDTQWLLLATGREIAAPDADPLYRLTLEIRGEYDAELYDTMSGTHAPFPAQHHDGRTWIDRTWHMHDSLLLHLTPYAARPAPPIVEQTTWRALRLPERVPYRRDEPNVLLLDRAEYAPEGEPLRPRDDILRIDNYCRQVLGMPPRKKLVAQPYTIPSAGEAHHVRLRMTFDAASLPVKLALEHPERAHIWLNGVEATAAPDGWYVDRAIRTVPLPPLREGRNVLEVSQEIDLLTGLEAMYLLGDFDVLLEGGEARLTSPRPQIAFGDITTQGMPFYTGNLTYLIPLQTEGTRLSVRVPQYRGALVEAAVDEKRVGDVVLSPYRLETGGLSPGRHKLALTLYGTRFNGFGQLHFTPGVPYYPSPDSWRSTGDLWTDNYQLHPHGILKTPEVMENSTKDGGY